MVVTDLPATSPTVTMQDFSALPSTCTVQAPQRPAPHPYLVPVRPAMSRRAHNRTVSSGPSSVRASPLMVTLAIPFPPLQQPRIPPGA